MKNKLFIVAILIAILCLAVACSPKLVDIDNNIETSGDKILKDNTTLYDDATQWMTEEYKYANRTRPLNGADDRPSEITNMITNQEDLDKAFNEFPTEINFDEQMLVLHFFASNNIFADNGKRLRYYNLNHVTQKEGNIYFEICITKAELLISDEPYADATQPTHLCLAFVMPKMNVEEFKFEFEYKKYYYTWKGDLKSNTTLYNADLDWLRDEYKEKNISKLAYPNTFNATIQTKEQYVSTFCKFYNDFDIEKDMLIVYCFTEENNSINDTYDYSITDIQYDKGFLEIEIDKRVASTQSGTTSTNTKILIIKLPQLPAYNVNITIN